LLQAVRERYRGRLKDEKLRILDEFVAVTGYHRKHVIRLFNAAPIASGLGRRARLPLYDEAVREAIIVLWEASDRVGGKRLRPLLPLLVSALSVNGHLRLDVTVRARVLAAPHSGGGESPLPDPALEGAQLIVGKTPGSSY
jgi:hypothetical protein